MSSATESVRTLRFTSATSARSRRGIARRAAGRNIARVLVVSVDVIMLTLAFLAFYVVRVSSVLIDDPMEFPLLEILQVVALLNAAWMLLFWFTGVYIGVHNRSLFAEVLAVAKVVVIGVALLWVALVLTSGPVESDVQSHTLVSLVIFLLFTLLAVAAGRTVVRVVLRRLRRAGIGLRRTVVIGDGERTDGLIELFDRHPELGFEVIGTVTALGHEEGADDVRSIGSLADLDEIITRHRVDVTIIGLTQHRDLVPKLITETAVADTAIKIIPDLYDMVSGQARAQHLYGIPLIEINPRIMPSWQMHVKRLMDIVASAFALVLGSPVWIATALAVKLEDGGPILYAQERVGLGGRTFMVYKFRSMRVDAERAGISWTAANDSRVTRVGRVIRKTHLDEIPQFWNVLRGEMSLVGPRPERPFYVEKFSRALPAYPRRLRVKPGVTGWNQVHMEDMTENLEFVQERLRHDFFYIENMSLRLDIEIIFRTVLRMIQRKGQA